MNAFLLSFAIFKIPSTHMYILPTNDCSAEEQKDWRSLHIHNRYNDAKYRSPEEYRYDPETAKIDVWALGSMIYMILTGKNVWAGVTEKKAQKKIASNESPPLDDKWKESNDPVDRLLVKVMYEWCFVPDPEKRPSAPEVAKFLEQESEKIMKEMGLSEEKVKDDRLDMDSSYDS